jgi:hypothetical protein
MAGAERRRPLKLFKKRGRKPVSGREVGKERRYPRPKRVRIGGRLVPKEPEKLTRSKRERFVGPALKYERHTEFERLKDAAKRLSESFRQMPEAPFRQRQVLIKRELVRPRKVRMLEWGTAIVVPPAFKAVYAKKLEPIPTAKGPAIPSALRFYEPEVVESFPAPPDVGTVKLAEVKGEQLGPLQRLILQIKSYYGDIPKFGPDVTYGEAKKKLEERLAEVQVGKVPPWKRARPETKRVVREVQFRDAIAELSDVLARMSKYVPAFALSSRRKRLSKRP